MNRIVDLHTHTTESDGSFTPEELMSEAKRTGLSAIAITDHDSISGIKKAAPLADELGIELIPGVELSTDYNGKEVHVVGLYVNVEDEYFLGKIKEFKDNRDSRNVIIVENLQKEGFVITMEELTAENPDCVITRANIARFLYEHGMIPTIQTAFEKYIGDNCKCYVNRFKITPMDGVRLIKEAGGTAILAHPLLYHMSDATLQKMVDEMKEAGLDGIEAIYCTYTPAEERQMKQFAKENGLLISGGSDFHGTTKPKLELGTGYGKLYIPYEVLAEIKNNRK
ncbi:MAG: PHP domain-containing protein [Lachnospiraceae bacterium]|nr:PHP domain-containing protein [Lachnospiraceae bacterium]